MFIIITTTTNHVVSQESQLSLAKLWSRKLGSIPYTAWVFHSTPYIEQRWKLFSLTSHGLLPLEDSVARA
jgi:hypothetical protein